MNTESDYDPASEEVRLADRDTGALPIEEAAAFDSTCDECSHQVAAVGNGGPKRVAITFVQGPDAIRRYLCPEHAADLLRYGTEPAREHPDAAAPTAERCRGCGSWTLKDDLTDPAMKRCPDCA